MKKYQLFLLFLVWIILFTLSISGCGRSAPTAPVAQKSTNTTLLPSSIGTPAAPYGMLTLSGTGTATTGTTFPTLFVASGSTPKLMSLSWYDKDLPKVGLTYPVTSLSLQYDASGTVKFVSLVYSTSSVSVSPTWMASSMKGQISSTSAFVSVADRIVTFNDLALPIASPATTMVLNGALRY